MTHTMHSPSPSLPAAGATAAIMPEEDSDFLAYHGGYRHRMFIRADTLDAIAAIVKRTLEAEMPRPYPRRAISLSEALVRYEAIA